MGYLINAWKETQKTFTMSLKQVVSVAGDGTLENDDSRNELRQFFSLIDLSTLGRLLEECYPKDKKYKFETRGFAFQDLINEMGRRLGFEVENGVYRGKKNEIGFDGLWKSNDGTCIIMESKTSDDYSISIESVISYRDKLLAEKNIPRKKCSILIVYGRDDKSALKNTAKGSDDAKSIRLISANALFQMVKIVAAASSDVIGKQVLNMLQPRDYFVLDNLVELVFPQTDADIPEIEDTEDDDFDVVPKKTKHDNNLNPDNTSIVIPPLPDRTLKAGDFIRSAMINLANSGFEFSDEEIEILCSEHSMHDIIGLQRKMPFFKKYDPRVKNGHVIDGRNRYYAKPISFGKNTVYLNSQLFDSDKTPFVNWYISITSKK